VQSCDTYFYSLAHDLGIDNIHSFISQFGFGKPTGIDLPGEADGVLPSRAWKRKRFGQQWYEGDTVSVGIGQGYDLVTPLQLANATAIIADNGTVYRPHVVSYIEDSRSHKNIGTCTEAVRHIQI
jgi:penicillin-binding protein 2